MTFVLLIMNELHCVKMKSYLSTHVKKVLETCSTDADYSWNRWEDYVDPLLKLSEAMGVDCEELQRARDSYVNAQIHIRHTKQALILKLQGMNIEKIIESDHLT